MAAGASGNSSTSTAPEDPRRAGARAPVLPWLLAGILGAALAVAHADPIEPHARPRASADDIRRIVKNHYYRDVDEKDLDYGAIRGMMGALDPFSTFMAPKEAHEFLDDKDGHFAGLGIEITVDKGYVTVIAPIEDTPAFEGGVLPGDRIIAIGGQPCDFASTDDAARVLRGDPGTKIALTVLHEGATRAEDLTLERRVIQMRTVKRPRLLESDPRIGYVRITHFKPKTAAQTRAAVEALLARGMKGLVLDLRSNPGGLLDEAIETVNLFVDEGLIVRTVGKDPAQQSERYARAGVSLGKFPLAVLVNGGSASASEVVAGALQDLGRASIVGTRSHGKGSVQTLMPLADGSLLKLTTSHYFTKSGHPIHREASAKETDPWGIMPDLAVDEDARHLVEVYRHRDGIDFFGEGPPTSTAVPLISRIERDDMADPQLDAAAALLASKLSNALAADVSGPASPTATATR